MAVRYETEINNLVGHYWKVQILDADYVGAAADFVLADFELDRKSLANRWDLIWGAECSLSVYSNVTNPLDTLIGDILDADEGRFQVVLYHKSTSGGTYAFYWIGLILNDLSGGVDEAPQQSYTIVAVDGLGALKGIDYSVDDVTPISTATVVTHLMNCLKQLPTASFFSSGDVFLKEAATYFEAQMPNLTGSPINWTTVPGTAFYEIDDNGIYKFKSCYDVLEILANTFFCRLFFNEGCWRFVDVRSWETSASLSVRPWTFGGTLGTAASESLRFTIDGTVDGARISGQQFGNLPPLRKLSRVYQHDTARNLVNGITVTTAAGLQNVIVGITESGTETLAISGALTVSASEIGSGAAYKTVYVKLRFQMKIGSYYLKRTVNNQSQNNDYSTLEWVSTVAYVEYIVVFGIQFLGGITLAVSFDTPALPNFVTGTLQVNLEKVYIQDLQQNNLSGTYNYSAVFASLYIEYVDGEAENERTYNVLNDTTAFFSETEELLELPVGDKINAMTRDRLLVWNGSAVVDADSDWGRNTLSGTKPLIQLVLENIMAGQRTTIRKRSGEFMGRFDSCDVLAISGDYYLPLSVRFSCNDGAFSGEWYKCGTYNDSNITTGYVSGVVTGVEIAPSVTPPSGSGNLFPTNVIAENGKLSITALSGADGFVVNDSAAAEAFKINDSGKVSSINQVVIGGNEFTTGVLFELRSTTQGFLPPRVTAAQKSAFESVVGLVVYQTDGTEGLYLYKSTGWELIG
jgi:hypothetical protein